MTTPARSHPLRVLHACSIVQEDPMLLPVPPVAGCAPCWNVYRLHEALADLAPAELTAEVISACERRQYADVQAFPRRAVYRHVIFDEAARRLSVAVKKRFRLSGDVLQRLVGTASWLAYRYMRAVRQYMQQEGFDLLVLDDSPQNLNYLSRFIPPERLVFLLRAQVGMSRRYFDRVGAIIVTNDNLADYARQLLPAGADPAIYVVPNSLGYEFDRVEEMPHPQKDDSHPTVVFAGRFVKEKGVQELLRAFVRVREQVPGARLRIVGGTGYARNGRALDTPYVQQARQIADTLPPGAVSFAGHVPYAQMPAEYLAADVAVFPSVWVEGFGMTALEAMRCGVPVVVSNRPGFTSFVRDGENGRVVADPTDAEALAAAIVELLTDRQKAARMAAAGKATALRYTPEDTARAYTDALLTYAHRIGLWAKGE